MNILKSLILLMAFGFCFVNAEAQSKNKSKKETSPMETNSGYKVGDEVENFTLINVDDREVNLQDYMESKGVIVIFTCNHCPFSVAYENRIIEIHNKFSEQGYPVVAINPNDELQYPEDSFDEMKVRAEQKGFPFVYLRDETQEIAKRFGATRTPHVFVLRNMDGMFTVQYIGAIDDNADVPEKVEKKYLENALEALIEGGVVENNFTKAIGCSIKWKK